MSFAAQARLLAGQAGLLLGWHPDAFWSATPDELASALAPLAGLTGQEASGIDRAALAALMELHPDG